MIARGNADWLMGRAQAKGARHLPLAFGEVAQFARPIGWFIREGLSLAALVVAGLAMFIIITGVLP